MKFLRAILLKASSLALILTVPAIHLITYSMKVEKSPKFDLQATKIENDEVLAPSFSYAAYLFSIDNQGVNSSIPDHLIK